MNIHSYTIVHYGADYLGYALKSIYDNVDQMHVIYTPHPSHGYRIDIPSIDSLKLSSNITLGLRK